MIRKLFFLIALGGLLILSACGGEESSSGNPSSSATSEKSGEETASLDYDNDIQPLFEKYCYHCHDNESKTKGIDLESITGPETLKADAHLAEELVEVFGEKKMPPETMPQPTAAEYQKLLGWVKSVGS